MTADEGRRLAEQLFASQPAVPADIDALGGVLARFPAAILEPGAVLSPGAGEVILLVEGTLALARPGAGAGGASAALGALHGPALVGQVGALSAAGTPAPLVCAAQGQARVLRIEAATFRSLFSEASPGGARFRWIVLGALAQQLTRMSDLVRTIVAGGGQGDPLAAAEAILEGCEPPRA